LQEAKLLQSSFPKVSIIGASDSAFHAEKPLHAATYGISQTDAKAADVWRFGYHGLSVASVVEKLREAKKLPKRLVVCHLGSGASVTAVLEGKSIDTSMGYSPLEGLVMSTRSGSIDPTAVDTLATARKVSAKKLQHYLNAESGLLGLSGESDDIRELLVLEEKGHKGATLALDTYVYRVQLAIGQMVAALGGIDGLVFTGTVGERSAIIRRRIVSAMLYLGLALDSRVHEPIDNPQDITVISQSRHPAIVMIVPTDEAQSILQAVHTLT
jgi:acetate kinase